MRADWEREAPRLVALARLDLAPTEAAELARACQAITEEFSALAAFAAGLPEAASDAPAPARADERAPAPRAEIDAILAAAPHVDAATRAIVVPRGLP